MRREEELYPEDLERVQQVINSGIHSVDRKPFRPGKLLVAVVIVLSSLSLASWLIARFAGVI